MNNRIKHLALAISISLVLLIGIKYWKTGSSGSVSNGGVIGLKSANRLAAAGVMNTNVQTRRVQTLNGLVGISPTLISEESESGSITKVYQFSPDRIVTKVILPNPKNPLLGSIEYEELSKNDYIKTVASETNLNEIKEILEDFPLARQSRYLYTGIRETYELRAKINELDDLELLLSARQDVRDLEIWSVSEPVERELKEKEVYNRDQEELYKNWLDKADAAEQFKQRMFRLYGDFPKPVFQRLMSVDINTKPEELLLP
jgi:hypothetical protein